MWSVLNSCASIMGGGEHGTLCRIRRVGQQNVHMHHRRGGQDLPCNSSGKSPRRPSPGPWRSRRRFERARFQGWASAAVAVQWIGGERIPGDLHETRHAKAFLKAQVNKSDRNDARGIAQMMRVGLFQPVHVKTLASQKRRALLAARKISRKRLLRSRTISVVCCAILD